MVGYLYMQQSRRIRTMWIHPINSARLEKGEFYTLYPDLRRYDDRFFEMYRMHVSQFDYILEMLQPWLEKQVTSFREPISLEQSLVLTIR